MVPYGRWISSGKFGTVVNREPNRMIRSNDFFCVPDCACGSASPYTEAELKLSIQISNDADD
jgi:hypothetical protein